MRSEEWAADRRKRSFAIHPDVQLWRQIYNDFFTDRPLEDQEPPEPMRPEDWIETLGLIPGSRQAAAAYDILSTLAADTRKILGAVKIGRDGGLDPAMVHALVEEGSRMGRRNTKVGKSEDHPAKHPGSADRFRALTQRAGGLGLRVNGDFVDGKHHHDHLDDLEEKIVAPKPAESPQEGADAGLDLPAPGKEFDGTSGRVEGHKPPKSAHERHGIQQEMHDVLDDLAALGRRTKGTPLETAHQHLLDEGNRAVKDPSAQACEYLRRRVDAFKRMVTGSDPAEKGGLHYRSGRFLLKSIQSEEPQLHPGRVAAELNAVFGSDLFAIPHEGRLWVAGDIRKAGPPPELIPDFGGGWISFADAATLSRLVNRT